MLKLDDNGFLGEGVDDWSRSFRQKHSSLLDRCEHLNRDAHSLLYSIQIHTEDGRETIVACLFMRAIEFYQAVILLLEKGMQTSAKGAFRCLLEVIFRLVAVAKDDTALQGYIDNNEVQRLRWINVAQKNKEPIFESLWKEDLPKIKKTIQEKHLREVKTKQFAVYAGMDSYWYDGIYRDLSGAVHSSVSDLEQYLFQDSVEKIEGLQYGPTDSHACMLLIEASRCLVRGLYAVNAGFQPDFKEKCDDHWRYFTEAMDALNVQEPSDPAGGSS